MWAFCFLLEKWEYILELSESASYNGHTCHSDGKGHS